MADYCGASKLLEFTLFGGISHCGPDLVVLLRQLLDKLQANPSRSSNDGDVLVRKPNGRHALLCK